MNAAETIIQMRCDETINETNEKKINSKIKTKLDQITVELTDTGVFITLR